MNEKTSYWSLLQRSVLITFFTVIISCPIECDIAYTQQLLSNWTERVRELSEQADTNVSEQERVRLQINNLKWYQSKGGLQKMLADLQYKGTRIYRDYVQAKNMVEQLRQLITGVKQPQMIEPAVSQVDTRQFEQQIRTLQAEQGQLRAQLDEKNKQVTALSAELERYKVVADQQLGGQKSEQLASCAQLEGELATCSKDREQLEQRLSEDERHIAQLELDCAIASVPQAPPPLLSQGVEVPLSAPVAPPLASSIPQVVPVAPPLPSGMVIPPAAAPPAASVLPAVDSSGVRSALMQAIRERVGSAEGLKKIIKPAEAGSINTPEATDARSRLMQEILAGRQLRPAEQRQLAERAQGQKTQAELLAEELDRKFKTARGKQGELDEDGDNGEDEDWE